MVGYSKNPLMVKRRKKIHLPSIKSSRRPSYQSARNSKNNTNYEQTNEIKQTPQISDRETYIGCSLILLGLIGSAVLAYFTKSIVIFFGGCSVCILIAAIITRIVDDNEKDSKKREYEKIEREKQAKIDELAKYDGVVAQIKSSFFNKKQAETIKEQLSTVPLDYRNEVFSNAIGQVLEDLTEWKNLERPDDLYIFSTANEFMPIDEIKKKPQYLEYVKFLTIQDILNGKIPQRLNIEQIPVNLQKNESLIWIFSDIALYSEVIQRKTVGQSSGFSIKIAKGIYYRVGAFSGQPAITTTIQPKYFGTLIITNQNIIFYSQEKSIKYPYKKVLAFVPFSDALGVQPDRANAKSVYFKSLDGRFAYNLVTNINQILQK